MKPHRVPKPMLERLIVGLFIGGFFAALPLWALSGREGWLRFRCGGSPWQCTITHVRAFSTRAETFTPSAIDFAVDEHTNYRGFTSRNWRLVFVLDGQRTSVLRGDDAGKPMGALARELESARASGTPLERELPPDFGFWLMAGLAALFAAAGIFIAVAAG